jgi:hypothetical protein
MRLPVMAQRIHRAFLKGEFAGRMPLSELGVRLWRWNPAAPEGMPFVVALVAWILSVGFTVVLIFKGHVVLGVLALPFVLLGAVAIPVSTFAWNVFGVPDLHRAIADNAGDLVDDMEDRVPVHCPQCGGHAAVVLLGGRDTAPCPWCDAPLDLPHDSHDWIDEARRALEKRHGGILDSLGASVWAWTGPGALSRDVQLPDGYEFQGFVMSGNARGFPVRDFGETSSFPMQRVDHIELMAPTGLAGEALWTRPHLEDKVRRVARVFRVRLPQSVNGRVDSRGWFHETTARLRVRPLPELDRVLGRLKRNGALLIDPGGVTVWRFQGGIEIPGDKDVAAFHDDLAALVLALRASVSVVTRSGEGDGPRC